MVFISEYYCVIMSRISSPSIEKIKEQILRYLYDSYPEMVWTYQVGDELVRDDEFVLKLLIELQNSGLVGCRNESNGGNVKRRWGMNKDIYSMYRGLL
jgi:hypothetical protein